jgi:hypothetical protein
MIKGGRQNQKTWNNAVQPRMNTDKHGSEAARTMVFSQIENLRNEGDPGEHEAALAQGLSGFLWLVWVE